VYCHVTMLSNRKCVVLTMKEKIDIIAWLKKDEIVRVWCWNIHYFRYKNILILDDQNYKESFLSFYKKINLKDCCYMLVEAWKCVQNCTLERSWNKLLKQVEYTQNVELNVEIAEIRRAPRIFVWEGLKYNIIIYHYYILLYYLLQ